MSGTDSERRVAVVGVFDIANYGDQLFPRLAAWRLAPYGVHVDAVAPRASGPLRPDALPTRDLDWLLGSQDPLHGVLIGGGNIVYNLRLDHVGAAPGVRFDGRYVGAWLAACFAAATRDVPFGFNAPGLPYPFSGETAAAALRPCLAAADVVGFRDEASRKLAAASGVETTLTPDTAADLARMWPRASLQDPMRALAGRVGWGGERYAAIHLRVMDRKRNAEIEAAAAAVNVFCERENLRPALIVIGEDLGDGEAVRRLAPLLARPAMILDGAVGLRELAAAIAHAEVYIGGSLHGYVTAAAYDTPGVIVTAQPHRKFGGFLDWVGRPSDLTHDWSAATSRASVSLRAPRSRIIPDAVATALDAHWQAVSDMLAAPRRRAQRRAALLRDLTARGVRRGGAGWVMSPAGRAAPATVAAMPNTIVDVLRRHASERPNAPAMTELVRGESPGREDVYAGLDAAALRIAARLRAAGAAGQSVLLCSADGPAFVRAFLGCLYAGAYAVPVPPAARHAGLDRRALIVRDAQPAAILADSAASVGPLGPDAPPLILIAEADAQGSAMDGSRAGGFKADGSIAFIQYTSGSTSAPKGVVVTHANIMANQAMIRDAFAHDERTVVASWLPLHHDMGLIGSVLQPLYLGGRCVLMSPLDFLQRPVRWLRAISTYKATTSGAPNFAYELCLRQITDDQAADLDLSSWRLAFCGSEPVRASTMARFAARFAASGFRSEALYPCYGMAEATLFVSGGVAGAGVRSRRFPRRGVSEFTTATGDEVSSVGCGRPYGEGAIAICPPHEERRLSQGEIGEICVAGPHVSPGVWAPGQPGGFRPYGERVLNLGGVAFLRSGDAGIVVDGDLHIVGRQKDMIIIRGGNLYAEDIEATVMEELDAGEVTAVAAVAVESDAAERLVLLCELSSVAFRAGLPDGIAEALRGRVARAHGVQPSEIVFAPPRSLPRTTSGKVRRGAARAAWVEGRLGLRSRTPA